MMFYLCLAHFWHFEVQFCNRLVLTMVPTTIRLYHKAMQCGVDLILSIRTIFRLRLSAFVSYNESLF